MKQLRLIEAKKYLKKTTDLDVSVTRLRHWIAYGLVNYSGEKVLLRARKRFGQWWTSDEYINEFIREQGE
jgi:hypothetical protein